MGYLYLFLPMLPNNNNNNCFTAINYTNQCGDSVGARSEGLLPNTGLLLLAGTDTFDTRMLIIIKSKPPRSGMFA